MSSTNDLSFATNPTDEEHGYQSGDELDIDPARRRDLLSHSRGVVTTGIRQIVGKALSQMSEEMSALSTKKIEADEQRSLLEAASFVGSNKAAVEAAFGDIFDQIFDRQLGLEREQEVAEQADQELALVDDSQIRDKLRRERLVNRTKNKLDSDEVLGIRARYGALMGRDWFDETSHPAAPEFIYEALQKAIDKCGDVAEVRAVMLQAFEPYVTANLNAIYAKANEQLRQQDVLPRIKPRVALTPDSGKPTASGQDETEAGIEHLKRPTGAADEETFILPPAGPARDSILQALANQVSEGGAQARSSAVRMLAEPKNFADDSADVEPPDDELIAALDSLQSDTDEIDSDERGRLEQLNEKARGSGSPLDQLTVEIVSLIFDFLYDDPRIPLPVKTQLLRLQVVAVKAALLDRSFFASRQHPMRRLIDRASELSCDPDTDATENSSFVSGLQAIVDQVLAEFDRDLAVFANAVTALGELEENETERRASELAQLTAAAQQTEVKALAGEEVRRLLMSRLDDMTPAFVREFVQDWWSEVMIDVWIKDGEAASQEYLELAEQLIWSVVVSSGTQINKMASVLPKMIAGLNHGLARLSASAGQHDAFFNELMKWHTKTIMSAKTRRKKSEGEASDSSSNVSLGQDGKVQFETLNEIESSDPDTLVQGSSLIDDLVKGQQMRLTEEGTEPIVIKLAWISPARKLFALSRFPDFARSVSRADMLDMLESGRLVRVSTQGTIDRAIEAVGSSSEDEEAQVTAAGSPVSPEMA